MARIVVQVNGSRHAVAATADTPLLYVLRNELRLHGPRFGCGLAQCGACTVHLGDEAIRSCVTPVVAVVSKPVTTLEGLGTPAKPHPMQTAFVEAQAAQCGFCINGMIMAATAFVTKTPNPTTRQVQTALQPYICRCGTHYRILEAVEQGAAAMRAA
jgi:nicotinate dehydrogenase subunit A